MKLKIDDQVYLQKYEIAHIIHDLRSFPGTLLDELFGGEESGFFFMNGPDDGFHFECAFKHPDNVAWLMAQDWIVDYDEFADMPLDELNALIERLHDEYRAGVDDFNAKDEDYRAAHFDECSEKYDLLGYRIASLRDLVCYRKGECKFVFPEGYPTKESSNSTSAAPPKKPGLFARLFKRNVH